MARLSKEEVARYGGANWLLEYAEKHGLEEARKEMERRGATGIPLGVKQTDLDKWCEEQKGNTVATIAIMAATVLFDEFEMTPEEIDRFWRRFTSKTESLMQRFVNWRELQEVLRDEAGLNFELPEAFTKEIGQ